MHFENCLTRYFTSSLNRSNNSKASSKSAALVRLELFRVRQLADKAAQALGYAVHRARKDAKEVEADVLQRLESTLAEHETEAKRLEGELERHRASP